MSIFNRLLAARFGQFGLRRFGVAGLAAPILWRNRHNIINRIQGARRGISGSRQRDIRNDRAA